VNSTESRTDIGSRTKGNVLLVDDNPSNLRLLSGMLTEKGYKVRPAPSGALALTSAQSTLPDIVLLDIKMPGMDGYEVCRRLKADEKTRHVPVLFISAMAEVADKIKGFNIGGVDYITKPFQHEEVLVRVETHVSLARMHKRLQQEIMGRKRAEELVKQANDELEQRVKERTLELSVANEQLKHEIKERRQAEETLRESEQKYRELADLLPQIVFEMDDTGTLTFVNRNAFDVFVYTQSEFDKGLNAFQMLIPEDCDRAMEDMQRVFNGDKLGGVEYTALRKDGDTFPIILDATPIWRDNKPIGLRGIIMDLTERKRAEEERMRLIEAINQAAESIMITDTKETILYVNPAFERLTGYTQEEAIGRNPRILKSGKHDEAFYKQMWHTLTSGETWRGEIINKTKDGTLFTEEATISPVFDNKGKIINYIGVKHDVTKQRVLEDQLRQAQKMETVGRLAGGVAHDFNNMLNVILGSAKLVMTRDDLDDSMLKNLQQIQKAAERSADITRQLLAFSRKQVIEPMVVNLNSLIKDIEKMFGRLLGKGIDILSVPEKEIWNIMADPGQIHQIVANLCINASDAMPQGGKLTIETANVTFDDTYCKEHVGFVPGCFVMLSISDNGIGMDKEILAHIFEPFFTTKEEGKGTGLGLASVYGAIKHNNGFIDVYSEPGQGTTFKLYFPRCAGEAEKPKAAVKAPKGLKTAAILLVDDDEMVRNLTEMMLEKIGHTVVVAETPEEALALCEKGGMDIDLLLSDVVMPHIGGKALQKAIEALKPGIKTLLMSGYTASVIARHGVLGKGMHFIQKPFSIEELARKVREAIEQ